MITLTRETSADWWDVEALLDLCFAPGREALPSYRFRDGIDPVADICLVARDETGAIAGAIRYWPVKIADRSALLLGPVAVHPTHQGEGLAASLIGDSLGIAKGRWDRVLLVGDAPYYGRFGFKKLTGIRLPPPTNPDRVLGLSLATNAWEKVTGTLQRNDTYAA